MTQTEYNEYLGNPTTKINYWDNCFVRTGPLVGDLINLGNPDAEKIRLDYILNSLSGQNRFLGFSNSIHDKRFSVLEHSIYVYLKLISWRVLDRLTLKTALAHDFTEAFIGDIISPIKEFLPQVKELEKDILWPVIAHKFDLLPQIPDTVFAADKEVMQDELSILLGKVTTKKDMYTFNVDPKAIVDNFLYIWNNL